MVILATAATTPSKDHQILPGQEENLSIVCVVRAEIWGPGASELHARGTNWLEREGKYFRTREKEKE